MRVIICEKDLAAKRIADILSSGDYNTERKGGTNTYSFEDTKVVGLSGHVFEYDFPKEYNDWSETDFLDLINADIIEREGKEDIIQNVRDAVEDASEVIIATDYDREGESIGYEAIKIAREASEEVDIKRATFSSITESEINDAFDNLEEPDKDLADAANTRRVIDLVWGATLTRMLSVFSGRLGKAYLSAGRVQTPTLALIIDKERERLDFEPEDYFKVRAILKKDGTEFEAKHKRVKSEKKLDEIKDIKKKLDTTSVSKKEKERKPPTPFNTTSFLTAAGKIGFSSSNALSTAQNLYLNGYISYPRTSNTVFSDDFDFKSILEKLKKSDELGDLVEDILDKDELSPTKGKKKSKDHPPIHPTDLATKDDLNKYEWKIYKLIVKRFLSVLADKSVEEIVKAKFEANDHEFKSKGRKIIEQGWMKYYPYKKKDENILPELEEGKKVNLEDLNIEKKKTNPPRRYGHSRIIKKMSKLNLGTKSTRPGILKKLSNRKYVSKGSSFIPTRFAFEVTDVLEEYAEVITKSEMTADLEEEMDEIEEGEKDKEEVISESKDLLREIVKEMSDHEEDIEEGIKNAYRNDLGDCPKCDEGRVKIVTSKKTGKKFLGCTNYPDCKNSWPLPQKAEVYILEEKCYECGMNKILVQGKRPFTTCPNINCPTRDDYDNDEQGKDEGDEGEGKD